MATVQSLDDGLSAFDLRGLSPSEALRLAAVVAGLISGVISDPSPWDVVVVPLAVVLYGVVIVAGLALWLVVTPTEWLVRQSVSWARNLYRTLTQDVTLREVLIPSIYSTLVWLKQQIPYAFGFDTREHMLTGSFVLAVFAFLAGFISAGATWVLIFVFAFTFAVGLVRFFPAVERRWPL